MPEPILLVSGVVVAGAVACVGRRTSNVPNSFTVIHEKLSYFVNRKDTKNSVGPLENVDVEERGDFFFCERSIPWTYECPITLEVMNDPVRAADGVIYERAAIEAWFEKQAALHVNGIDVLPHSPCTGMPLASKKLVPEYKLASQIRVWRDSHSKARTGCEVKGYQPLHKFKGTNYPINKSTAKDNSAEKNSRRTTINGIEYIEVTLDKFGQFAGVIALGDESPHNTLPILVNRILPSSVAANLEIQRGDQFVAINDEQLRDGLSATDFANMLIEVERPIKLTLARRNLDGDMEKLFREMKSRKHRRILI